MHSCACICNFVVRLGSSSMEPDWMLCLTEEMLFPINQSNIYWSTFLVLLTLIITRTCQHAKLLSLLFYTRVSKRKVHKEVYNKIKWSPELHTKKIVIIYNCTSAKNSRSCSAQRLNVLFKLRGQGCLKVAPIDNEFITNTSPVRVNNWRSQTNFGLKSTKKLAQKKGHSRQHWPKISSDSFQKYRYSVCLPEEKIQETVELFLQFQIVAAQNDAFSTITWKNDSPDSVHQIGYNLLHQYF